MIFREGLQELSKDENRPMSDIVRESLRRYLAIYCFRSLRKTTIPFAEAQGILYDEDVFEGSLEES